MSLSENREEQCELNCSLQILKDVPLFLGIAPEFFRVMAYLSERRVFAAGQVILRAEEEADGAAVLVRGSARIEHGEHLFTTRGKGACVGGMALLSRFPWPASLRAETEVECLLLPRHKLLPQFIARPEALAALAGTVVGRVIDWQRRQLKHQDDANAYDLGML